MRVSTVLTLALALLIFAGVFSRALGKMRASRAETLLMLLAVSAISAVSIDVSDDIRLMPACFVLAAYTYIASVIRQKGRGIAAIPVSIVAGMLVFPLWNIDPAASPYLIGVVSALPAFFISSAQSAAASAVLSPPVSSAAWLVYCSIEYGCSLTDCSEPVFAAQLVAYITVLTIESIKTERNNRSDVRTNVAVRTNDEL